MRHYTSLPPKHETNIFVYLILFILVPLCTPAFANSTTTLLNAVDLTLSQRDTSRDLKDSLVLAKMNVSAAEHKFTTKLIPLTNIGFVQGTDSQKLGMEFRKETPTGTSIQYGVVANRLDDKGDYAVTNPNITRAFVRLTQGLFRCLETEGSRQSLTQRAIHFYYDLVLAKQLHQKAQQPLNQPEGQLNGLQ